MFSARTEVCVACCGELWREALEAYQPEAMTLGLHVRPHRAAREDQEAYSGQRGTSSLVPHNWTLRTVPASLDPRLGPGLAGPCSIRPGARVELLVCATISGIPCSQFWQ